MKKTISDLKSKLKFKRKSSSSNLKGKSEISIGGKRIVKSDDMEDSKNISNTEKNKNISIKFSVKEKFKKLFTKKVMTPENVLKSKVKRTKITFIPFYIFIGFLVLLYILLSPLLFIKDDLKRIENEVLLLQEEISEKDLSNFEKRTDNIIDALDRISRNIGKYKILSRLTFTQGYFDNLNHTQSAVRKSQDFLTKATPKLKVIFETMGYSTPEFDDDSENSEMMDKEDKMLSEVIDEYLEAHEDDVDPTMQDWISALPEFAEFYDEMEADIIDIIHTVNRIDPEYIPESLIGDDRKDQIVQALETSQFVETELIYNSEKFKRTLEYLPDILGSERPVTVLVVFQNEKEMRASGGLLSAYAIMTIDKGEIVGNIKSIDMWELQL